jgi:hypothetical protein
LRPGHCSFVRSFAVVADCGDKFGVRRLVRSLFQPNAAEIFVTQSDRQIVLCFERKVQSLLDLIACFRVITQPRLNSSDFITEIDYRSFVVSAIAIARQGFLEIVECDF